MAQTAEKLARRYNVTREDQAAFALLSEQRAAAANAKGAVTAPAGNGKTIEVTEDDYLKSDSTMEALAKLPTAFSKDGFVTAGNASGVVDGERP